MQTVMDPIFYKFHNLEIRWYSIFILIGIIIAIFLILKEAKRFKIDKEDIFNMCFYAIIFGIIGARLYYVLFNNYDFIDIFKIWKGGLAIHGGLIAGIITIYLYCKKKNLEFLRILDIIAPAVIIAQAIGRWGNFFNSEAYGFATSYSFLKSLYVPEFIIKGMFIKGQYWLPTFYFESLWCLLGFIILIIVRRLKYIKVGMLSCLYIMWYSFGRFFIEAWRTDSLYFFDFKVAQVVSASLFFVSLIYFVILLKKGKYTALYNKIN